MGNRQSEPDEPLDNEFGDGSYVPQLTSLTEDDLGFGDYNSEETLTTLEESLTNPRASSDRDVDMAVQIQPGTEFRYSGGSFLILQLLIEEVSGMPLRTI